MLLYKDINKDFPILDRKVHGQRLVYLDNAATSLKPRVVAEVVASYYRDEASSVHRGAHYLSEEATRRFEEVREKVARFINAPAATDIVFTSGTTASLNLLAQSFGLTSIASGDEIIISQMEHHSNIVPWQMLCQKTGARLKVIPIDDSGTFKVADFKALLSPKTKLVSIMHVSNVLGTINPIEEIAKITSSQGIPFIVDGAQAVPHMHVDVQKLGCDFYVASAHKMFGPTGLGFIYMKQPWMERLQPVNGGGNMIRSVSFEKTTYAEGYAKFEPGTPNIASVLGLGTAIDFLGNIGLARITDYEHSLLHLAEKSLLEIPGVSIIGKADGKAAVVSFVMDEVHPHDVGTILDQQGIAVRTGHHCCQPLMKRFNIPATTRASFSFYNTEDDVKALVAGIKRVKEIFR